jgi:hypothetical protein
MAASNIDPSIFEHLQAKIDEDGKVKDVKRRLLEVGYR